MLYKTTVLGLLEQRPRMHEQRRKQRMLLATMESLAVDLKARHETWKEQLSRARPGSDPHQIASAALELALKELEEDSLPPASPPEEDETLSLDAAMAYLRHTPPA